MAVMRAPRRRPVGPVVSLLVMIAATACTATNAKPPIGGQGEARLSAADAALAEATRRRALETKLSRETAFWSNEASGNAGRVMPVRTYRTTSGYYCRVYRASVFAGGRTAVRTATACRDEDGVWQDIPES